MEVTLEVKCHRCGKCCFFIENGVSKPCRYLVIHGKLTSCRIYPNRLGTKITKKFYCALESPFNYLGCPFNTLRKTAPISELLEDSP